MKLIDIPPQDVVKLHLLTSIAVDIAEIFYGMKSLF